jgi:hypothetical protein
LSSITHPLVSMDDATLNEVVEAFHKKKQDLKDVVDLETLQRGARLAQDHKMSLEHHQTAKEKKELEDEKAGKLQSMTKALRVLLCTCAIGAIVQ